ncbi:MAG TPA: hypothetical protein VEA39_07150 [Methylophilaceae bacterium]|nr:hypothetical protein [Methylophilaceae bacterium]
MQFSKIILTIICAFSFSMAQARVLPEAVVGIKIPLAKKPSTRPMGVAYVPHLSRYYIADGGLAPMPGDMESPFSKSLIHVYDDKGGYLNSAMPGFDNRAIYFNPHSKLLELITYNISSSAGFAPNTGIFGLELTDKGDVKEGSKDITGYNPAFGEAGTMPSYDPETKRYYAKQERSNLVFIVDPVKREKIGEIKLDLNAAEVKSDGISDHYVAFTGMKGEELALLDIDHKAVLIFDLNGKLVGKSKLPQEMKLRAQNHYNGLGYANGMMFIYHEPEGDFGTYYGFKVLN